MDAKSLESAAKMIAERAIREQLGTPTANPPMPADTEIEVQLVWASWCGHCTRFKPHFDALRKAVESISNSGPTKMTFSTVSVEELQSDPKHPATDWVKGFPTIIVKTTRKLKDRGTSAEEFFKSIASTVSEPVSTDGIKAALPKVMPAAAPAVSGGETSIAEGERLSKMSTLGQCLVMSLRASSDPRAAEILKGSELMACAANAEGEVMACVRAKSDPSVFSLVADSVGAECKELNLSFFSSPKEAHAATKAAVVPDPDAKHLEDAKAALEESGVVH